jgi:hypothetical protein
VAKGPCATGWGRDAEASYVDVRESAAQQADNVVAGRLAVRLEDPVSCECSTAPVVVDMAGSAF